MAIRATSQIANGSVVQSMGESFGGKLRLFIDTADADSWQRWLPSGAFYGEPVLVSGLPVVHVALYFSSHFSASFSACLSAPLPFPSYLVGYFYVLFKYKYKRLRLLLSGV